jgi:CheY-like chemotaxis protein
MTSILLVDDDDEFRAMLGEVLTRAGYQVALEPDGQRAIDHYASHRTDLVITDLVMPEKEGIQLIVELKRLNSKVKIIAVSGAGQSFLEEYLKLAKILGAQRVLAKPFSEEEVLEAVRQVLDGS